MNTEKTEKAPTELMALGEALKQNIVSASQLLVTTFHKVQESDDDRYKLARLQALKWKGNKESLEILAL